MFQFPPSRTFALSAFASVVIALVLFGLVAVLVIQAVRGAPELGELLTTIQVLAGSLAAVGGAGAGSMALRDFGSKGLTSSQAPAVVAAGERLDGP